MLRFRQIIGNVVLREEKKGREDKIRCWSKL